VAYVRLRCLRLLTLTLKHKYKDLCFNSTADGAVHTVEYRAYLNPTVRVSEYLTVVVFEREYLC